MTDPDLRCAWCKYMLKGLDLAGDCPECGPPIRDSLIAGGKRWWFEHENKLLKSGRIGIDAIVPQPSCLLQTT